ncbi:MAG: D-alanine--poly(phosphoribitol) ligase subunit DltC [Chthoniobacterales bacterium]
MMTSDTADKVLELLVTVTGTDEVRANPDLPLYDSQVLDSMKTVELMIALEEELGVKVSPAEFEREMWKTPRKIIADVEQRLKS